MHAEIRYQGPFVADDGPGIDPERPVTRPHPLDFLRSRLGAGARQAQTQTQPEYQERRP
ncbi:MAG TPA: hypothetical protein VGK67_03300 [Myxococcales bacterium]